MKKIDIILIVAIVILVGLIGGGVYMLLTRQSATSSQNSANTTATLNTLAQKPSMTDADLAGKDASDLFYGYYKNASMQPKLIITKEFTVTTGSKPASGATFTKTGFDYATKKTVFASDFIGFEGAARDRSRCIDGQFFYKGQFGQAFKREPNEDATNCTLIDLSTDINDGINTGGLTQEQADAYVDTLRNHINGYMQVKSMNVEQHSGKSYIHFKVEMRPVYAADFGEYVGAQWLMTAFKKTGQSAADYPYATAGALADGFDYDYYVDPTTQLPAYSTLMTTGRVDANGNPNPAESISHYKIQYEFGTGEFDNSTANEADINLTW